MSSIIFKYFSFFSAEEEEWAEGTAPKDNEDALMSEDDPEWQQEESNTKEKMVKEEENDVEEKFEGT